MTFRKYDVILVNLGDDIIGSEQGGIRPAVIIQNDTGNKHSRTTIVLPLTSHIKNLHQPTHTLIEKTSENGLEENSMLLGECIRQISEKRIEKYIGKISDINQRAEIKRVYQANFGD